MPRQYEHIRDRYVSKGVDYDKAQSIAAATYNKLHPKAPMSPTRPEGGTIRDAVMRRLRRKT